VLHVPDGIGRGEAAPLVLNLHGSGSSAKGQEAFSGMDTTADANHFLLAYPQGGIAAGKGFDWNVPGVPLLGGKKVPASAPDDVAYVRQLVHTISAGGCVDARRVYATGFSGGSRMVSQLACEADTPLAAIAPVSGLRYPTPCANAAPVPVLTFHGTKDPVDPYDGHGEAYWTYSVPQAAAKWATHDGCQATSETSFAPGTKTLTHTACTAGSTVVLYTITGEGHEWPGGPHLPKSVTNGLGPQSTAVQADGLMWSFFAAHPKR
jgi:polyhydroxybutyrate depolymerase